MRLLSLITAVIFFMTNQSLLVAQTKKSPTATGQASSRTASVKSLTKKQRAELLKRSQSRIFRASQSKKAMAKLAQELNKHKTLKRLLIKSSLLQTKQYRKTRAALARLLKNSPSLGRARFSIDQLSLGFLIKTGADEVRLALSYSNPGQDIYLNGKKFGYNTQAGLEANIIKIQNLLGKQSASLIDILVPEAQAIAWVPVIIVVSLLAVGGTVITHQVMCSNRREWNDEFNGLVSDVATNRMSTNWMPEEEIYSIGNDRRLVEFQLEEEDWEGATFCMSADEEGLKDYHIANHVTGPRGVCRRIAQRVINEQKAEEGLSGMENSWPSAYFRGEPPQLTPLPALREAVNSEYNVNLNEVADVSGYAHGHNLELFRQEINEDSQSLRVYERTMPTRDCSNEEEEILSANSENPGRPILLDNGDRILLAQIGGVCQFVASIPAGASEPESVGETTFDIIPFFDLPEEARQGIVQGYLSDPANCIHQAIRRLVHEANDIQYSNETTGVNITPSGVLYQRAREEANGISPDANSGLQDQ